jgi:hypothetical protein
MGSKKEKKRYFIVTYNIKKDGKFDEFVELSKKKIGSGKLASAQVVLDMVNREVIKCRLPGVPVHMEDDRMPYENVEQHYRKWYADVMDEFLNS